MGVSYLDLLREVNRQQRTGDTKFLEKNYYAFVLRGPSKGSIGPRNYAVFPLPLNPQDLIYELPFAAEVSPLQEGGVVSEEAGIVIGDISIDVNFGFKPKKDWSTAVGPGDGEFTGLLGAKGNFWDEISGQLHFWRLANRCFDAYSALKKDPAAAPLTSMEFHSFKDELHLQVVPQNFSLRRNASRERVSYRFMCRLQVVGPAGMVTIHSPDKSLLERIKDTISKIRNSIQAIAATIDDVTAVLDEIRRTISSVINIINDVTQVINSFTDFINGTKSFLDIPRQTLVALTEQIEAVGDLAASAAGWPADVAQAFRDLSDQCDSLIVAGTTHFREKWNRQVERYQQLVRGTPAATNTKNFGITSAPGQGPTTFDIQDIFGGGERPGDVRRSVNIATEGRLSTQQYQGFTEYAIGSGDTLQSLAAKHLGDARQWIALAIVNDLQAPYISDKSNIPNTLKIGDKIIIPIAAPQNSPDTITSGDPLPGASQAEDALGADFLVTLTADKKTYGWEIDKAGGSVDVLKVKGINNFSQGLGMRFRTEQGQNILYPSIGIPRGVGEKNLLDPFSTLNYQARVQLLADKRTERLGRFAFRVEQDQVILEADIQPVGYNSLRTIKRTLT